VAKVGKIHKAANMIYIDRVGASIRAIKTSDITVVQSLSK